MTTYDITRGQSVNEANVNAASKYTNTDLVTSWPLNRLVTSHDDGDEGTTRTHSKDNWQMSALNNAFWTILCELGTHANIAWG